MAARSYQDYIETALEPWGDVGVAAFDWGAGYISPTTPFSVGNLFNPVTEPAIPRPAPNIFPTVRIQPPVTPTPQSSPAVAGPATVPIPAVIDPSVGATTTVYETAPGGIYQTNRAPTDWGKVYDEYVILNAPQAAQEAQVPIDWGKVAGGIIGGYLDPFGAGQATTNFFGMAAPPAAVPTTVTGVPSLGQQVKIDPRTGQLVKCRRRRRRRLLTDGDFNDLMRISTLPNKDIVKIALAKAVGR